MDQDHTASSNAVFAVFVYLSACWWAIAKSAQRKKTIARMVISLAVTWGLLIALGLFFDLTRKDGGPDLGGALAAAATIPSLMVPAIVGVIHARKHRR